MKKRIMIVDDDPDILIAFRQVFQHEGYEVYTVDSGMDCIKEIENGFKGLILIDIMMPFMDGWETIKEIIKKDLGKNVIISIISAKGSPDNEKMKEISPYIFNYITKPIDLKELINNVNKMFNSKKI
jgi:DNA-binding response OmpR family regulator